jgi:hypothetical protein
MFTVPEVDDDMDVSSSVETVKPLTQAETSSESPPAPASTTQKEEQVLTETPVPPNAPASTIEKDPLKTQVPAASASTVEKDPIKIQVPPAPTSKQHLSRLSLFHRNTIHVCDQINDRV